ncbi:hypothetical protein IWQ60_010176 [Tieghemiomyces parasiticus]|uniref:J domain-containing protein n=1 Tax=Tieghemiomyces parasiticus TaxID=78921 RepID=A0A9W7ZRA9_9FUNG|nr:hypothetical protein IWQ60_010176 [Tieghemiomyces parasiticus]
MGFPSLATAGRRPLTVCSLPATLFHRTFPALSLHTPNEIRSQRWAHAVHSKRSPYQVFDLPLTATPNDIKKRYRELCMQWHPDLAVKRLKEAQAASSLSSSSPTSATESIAKESIVPPTSAGRRSATTSVKSAEEQRIHQRFVEITDAYQVLSDPVQRKRYLRLAASAAAAAGWAHGSGGVTHPHQPAGHRAYSFHPGDAAIYNNPSWQRMYTSANRHHHPYDGPNPFAPEDAATAAYMGDSNKGKHDQAIHIVMALCGAFGLFHFIQVMSISSEARERYHHEAWVAYDESLKNARAAGDHQTSVENFLARKAEADRQREMLARKGY